jgi:hypothetical protein
MGKNRERRAFPRRSGRAEIQCRLDKLGMSAPVKGRLLDLSQDGAAFTIAREVAENQEIEIEFAGVGSTKSVRIPAVVLRAIATDDGLWRIITRFEKRLPYANYQQLVR